MSQKTIEYYEVLSPVKTGGKTFWSKIGAVFPHDDYFTGEIHSMPLNGQIVLKKPTHKPQVSKAST